MKYKIPLIYMQEVSRGNYFLQWPVFIVEEQEWNHSFIVETNTKSYEHTKDVDIAYEPNELERKYATRLMTQRIYQSAFREQVLVAYSEHCAICSLKHRELLDAAHIIPDSMGGQPTVPNGLSLCKIHHAAFDQNIMGITPDYIIKIRQDILEEIDGPMLKYGIQQMEGNKIRLPRNERLKPNPDWLDQRFQLFKKIG
jgi:putative restriction endonuclease